MSNFGDAAKVLERVDATVDLASAFREPLPSNTVSDRDHERGCSLLTPLDYENP
jgi:hypothetical protein